MLIAERLGQICSVQGRLSGAQGDNMKSGKLTASEHWRGVFALGEAWQVLVDLDTHAQLLH